MNKWLKAFLIVLGIFSAAFGLVGYTLLMKALLPVGLALVAVFLPLFIILVIILKQII